MKRERIDVLNERDLLYGMITSEKFCREIAPILEPRLLEIDYARLVAGWVKEYYETYKTCPQKDMSKLYRAHSDEISDEALKDNILTFLAKLDKDYDSIRSFNDEYALQQSILYLKRQSLRNLVSDVDAFLTAGNVTKAENAITKYRKLEQESGEGVDILNDSTTVKEAFTEDSEKLFAFKGDYGKLVGDVHREDFIAFLASMKVGKTFALIDCGIEAMRNGLKAVMFSLEMSRTDMIKRVWKSLSGQVTEDTELVIPKFVESNGRWIIEEKVVAKTASSVLDIEKKQAYLKRMFRGGEFKIYAEPAYSFTVEDLEVKLDDLEHDGFIPDVIIVDYADIMRPSDTRAEYRNQLDGIWKRLRALAQKRKCAVFTASQANRAAINGPVELENLSEDIRKSSHVTSMVSISKNKYCKKHNLAIFSQLVIREGTPITDRVIATQCLGLGRPVLDSHWEKDVLIEDNEFDDMRESYSANERRRK